MPSLPDVDERFEELAALVRAARPRPPEALRERVRELAAAEPPARRSPVRGRRRLALVLAPAALVAIVAAAAVVELRGPAPGAGRDAAAPLEATVPAPPTADAEAQRAAGAVPSAVAPQTDPGRAQDVRADLSLRVANANALSRATTQAMRIARDLGGYVVHAELVTPTGGEADSTLVVRVPVERVQDALVRLASLGTIVSQQFSIDDLQETLDRQAERIAALRVEVARLEEELEARGLSRAERARLRAQLEAARGELERLTRQRDQVEGRAELAEISLALTTRKAAVPVAADESGYAERTLEDAVDVLGRIGVWALVVLLVAAPFALVLAAAAWVERGRRRRGERRLLERS
jgi:hypothetical protein